MNAQQLCKDFLRLHNAWMFDAITAAQEMNRRWGIRVDWHEMAYALDEMERQNMAVRHFDHGNDGMMTYTIRLEGLC